MAYLIDSNVIINYMAQNFNNKVLAKLDAVFDASFNYSVISKMEVLGYKLTIAEINSLEDLFNNGNIFQITDDVVTEVINIRRTVKVKLPDAIIAAKAIINNFELVTDNITDFSKAPGLKVIKPESL
ncbi:MAG: type II toxin-antitoxin system VapC family toxin [Chitinophagaceae bacterium]